MLLRMALFFLNYPVRISQKSCRATVGKSFQVLSSEIKRVIREALLADSRITDVTDFTVEQIDKRTVHVSFTAETIFGEIPVERTVTTGV